MDAETPPVDNHWFSQHYSENPIACLNSGRLTAGPTCRETCQLKYWLQLPPTDPPAASPANDCERTQSTEATLATASLLPLLVRSPRHLSASPPTPIRCSFLGDTKHRLSLTAQHSIQAAVPWSWVTCVFAEVGSIAAADRSLYGVVMRFPFANGECALLDALAEGKL